MFGLVIEEVEADGDSQAESEAQTFYLLPENQAAWRLWLRVQTQWRIGGDGLASGMDYAGVVARIGTVSRRRRERLMDDLHVMELAALEEFARQRELRRSKHSA